MGGRPLCRLFCHASWLLLLPTVGCSGELTGGALDEEERMPLAANQLAMEPEADTTVRSGAFADEALGDEINLWVSQSHKGTEERTFLRFGLGEVGAIQKAVLRLYVLNGSNDAMDVVQIADTTWSESTTSWNTQPSAAGTVVGTVKSVRSWTWVSVDVTAAAQSGSVLSLALLPRSNNGVRLRSREAHNRRPRLVITLVSDSSLPASTPDSGVPTPAPDSGVPPAPDSGAPPPPPPAPDSGTPPPPPPAPDSGTPPPPPPAPDSGTPPPTGSVWQPKPGTTWHWQLTGTLDQNVDVQMYDIDLFETSASTIAALQAKGRVVICYFSAGSQESYRPDAADFPSAAVGKTLSGWPDERWLDIRSSEVRAIMAKRLDLAKSKGCDGVEPDNVDAYTNNTGFPLTAADQLSYNIFLATEAHARGLSVGLKNDVDQVSQLVSHFDWALNEECMQYNECSTLTPFINAGKAVFHVEYTPTTTSSVCPKAAALGFDSQIKKLDLDAWADPCW